MPFGTQTKGNLMATYTKLRSGYWGIRVSGSAAPGDRVTVRTKAGREQRETVSRVLWSGDGVSICEIATRPKRHESRKPRVCLCDDPCNNICPVHG